MTQKWHCDIYQYGATCSIISRSTDLFSVAGFGVFDVKFDDTSDPDSSICLTRPIRISTSEDATSPSLLAGVPWISPCDLLNSGEAGVLFPSSLKVTTTEYFLGIGAASLRSIWPGDDLHDQWQQSRQGVLRKCAPLSI
jgi:hypothetical protein